MTTKFKAVKFLVIVQMGIGLVMLVDGTHRVKRQLFREDIPHHRPLDGSYNQRPQGENNQSPNTIEDSNDHFVSEHNFKTVPVRPVRFSELDAKHSPYSYPAPFNHDHNNNGNGNRFGPGNGKPYRYNSPPGPRKIIPLSHQPPLPPPHPHLNQFSSLSSGLLDFHENSFHKDSPHHINFQNQINVEQPFENKLHALWNLNYDRNVPSHENGPRPISYAFQQLF